MHALFELLFRGIAEALAGLAGSSRPGSARQWAAWLALAVILLALGGIAVLGMALR
jgi:hypothetical protein